MLDPRYCLLTDDTGYHSSNTTGDPSFVLGYENGGRGTTVTPGEPTTGLGPAIAFDEGGNFIKVRYGPLTLTDDPTPGDGDPGALADYHLTLGSPAIDAGTDLDTFLYPFTGFDYDFEPRPNGDDPDIGADEYYAP